MSNDIAQTGVGEFLPHPESHLGKVALASLPYVILYAVAVVLIAMTDHDPASAQGDWKYFIPLVGLISASGGWARHAGQTWDRRMEYIAQQVLHWSALLVVIHLLFLSDVQHFLRAEDDGFVIIYLVGLSSILGGIYLDWKMTLFGLFLIFSGVIIAFLDDNALLIAVGGLAALALIGTGFAWIKLRHGRERKSQTT